MLDDFSLGTFDSDEDRFMTLPTKLDDLFNLRPVRTTFSSSSESLTCKLFKNDSLNDCAVDPLNDGKRERFPERRVGINRCFDLGVVEALSFLLDDEIEI